MRLSTLHDYTRQKVMMEIQNIRRDFPGCEGLLLSQEEFGALCYILRLNEAAHDKVLSEVFEIGNAMSWERKWEECLKIDSVFYSVKEEVITIYEENRLPIYIVPIDAAYCDFLGAFIGVIVSVMELIIGNKEDKR